MFEYKSYVQKQSPRGVIVKKGSEKIGEVQRKTPVPQIYKF